MTKPNNCIYMDNNATTRLDPRVLDYMMPYLTDIYGNAASNRHSFGWEAKDAVEASRAKIAKSINATKPTDIIFTSGATESINLAIVGLIDTLKGGHVITSQIEHKAVLDSCALLESKGVEVTYLRPQSDGIVSINDLNNAIKQNTRLVTIMTANNEIGTIQKIKEIGDICSEKGILFHTDATQALGKVGFDVQQMNVSLASFSAHKIYGPKGIGALYINSQDPHIKLSPLALGGGHEQGLRSGTLNVPGIVGFGKAVEISLDYFLEDSEKIRHLHHQMRSYIVANIPNVRLNGNQDMCLPGLINVSFDDIDADSLLLELSDIALSSGSACNTAKREPSHVLQALGLNKTVAQSSVRFGLGRFNTEREVLYTCRKLKAAVERLRSMIPQQCPA